MKANKPSMMANYIKMVVFVLVLGAISALVLIGVDVLTKERIENNKKIELYSTIFDHNDVSYNESNLVELFENGLIIKVEEFYYNEKALEELFEVHQNGSYIYFKNNENDDITIVYEDIFKFGPGGNDTDTVTIVLVISNNLRDVVRLDVVHDEDESFWGKRDLLIDEVLAQVKKLPLDGLLEVDATAKVTKTNESLFDSLNSNMVNFNVPTNFQKINLDELNLNEKVIESIIVNNRVNLSNYIELTSYRHLESRNLSFEFRGKGLWGDIYGVMTLKEDLVTIVDVSVLAQEETPGLGAIIGERSFLDQLEGKIFAPTIRIGKNPVGDSEVDQVTGATSTSGAFQIILNNIQDIFYTKVYGPRQDGVREMFSKILIAHGISFTDTDDLEKLVNNNFYIDEKDDLILYTNKSSSNVSFVFVEELRFGQDQNVLDDVTIILSLESDFETILNLAVIHDKVDAHWGKTRFLTEENLENFNGKKLPLTIKRGDVTGDHEVDNTAASSTKATQDDFERVLNDNYQLFLETFRSLRDLPDQLMKDILDAHKVSYTNNNFKTIFEDNFTFTVNGELKLYIYKQTNDYSYIVNGDVRFGNGGKDTENVTVVVSLENDFKTIKDLKVYTLEGTQWGKTKFLTEENLENIIGKKFPNIVFIEVLENEDTSGFDDNEVDYTSGVTALPFTVPDFQELLNNNYDAYYNAFGGNK